MNRVTLLSQIPGVRFVFLAIAYILLQRSHHSALTIQSPFLIGY